MMMTRHLKTPLRMGQVVRFYFIIIYFFDTKSLILGSGSESEEESEEDPEEIIKMEEEDVKDPFADDVRLSVIHLLPSKLL